MVTTAVLRRAEKALQKIHRFSLLPYCYSSATKGEKQWYEQILGDQASAKVKGRTILWATPSGKTFGGWEK
jgi:hypothetical protein